MAGFEDELTGGHPNSLGNTIQVVDAVLENEKRISELFDCYDSQDEVVRLRTSNAFKRLFRERPHLFQPLIRAFFDKIPLLMQPSAEWTLAQICLECQEQLSSDEKAKAIEIIKNFIVYSDDWIVLNNSIETLGTWALDDTDLKEWLIPFLETRSKDHRKSIAKRATKHLKKLT